MKDQNVVADCLVIEPVNIRIDIIRNLSASWYHKHPDVDISGKLESFSVSMIVFSVINLVVTGFQSVHYSN